MGDHFEQALQDIARNSNGGGKTLDDLFTLSVAANEDGEERHAETMTLLQTASDNHEAVCARVTLLEEWREEQQTTCRDRVTRLIEAEHDQRHGQHMAEHHTAEQQRLQWLLGAGMSSLSNVIWAVIGGLTMALLTYFVWGSP